MTELNGLEPRINPTLLFHIQAIGGARVCNSHNETRGMRATRLEPLRPRARQAGSPDQATNVTGRETGATLDDHGRAIALFMRLSGLSVTRFGMG
jgi:hypothetical protein